jgi:hypothetical protein
MKNLDSYLKSREPASKISTLELKRLLALMADNPYSICFRYRCVGDMWQPNFMRVMGVTDKGVVLKDIPRNKIISVPDLKMIMQFELDGSLHGFAPNFHYTVVAV